MNNIPIFYFTFGFSHIHPVTGEPMRDYWIEIKAKDRQLAQEKMFEIFGKEWSMCYKESDFDKKYFPKGSYMKYD